MIKSADISLSTIQLLHQIKGAEASQTPFDYIDLTIRSDLLPKVFY
jgi:hypothetical protein